MKITRENKTVVTNAEVTAVEFGENVSTLTVSYKVYDKNLEIEVEETESIPFYNSKDKEYPQLADRIVKAGIEAGTRISVLFVKKDDKIFGQNFCFGKGRFTLPSENMTYNIIQGYVTRISSGEGRFSVTIPVETGKDQTDWLSITFWNNETAKMADRASKVIREGDLVAVLCGAVKEKTVGEKVYKNLSGYRFEIIRKKEQEEQEQS